MRIRAKFVMHMEISRSIAYDDFAKGIERIHDMLYDILAQQEYLGHTITAKTYKVSYKSKRTRKNVENKRYFSPNTHEPLIDAD